MDEPCVHCGEQIVEMVPSLWIHIPTGRLCADGSGHVACPAQGGIE